MPNIPNVDINKFMNDFDYAKTVCLKIAQTLSGADSDTDDWRVIYNAMFDDKESKKVVNEMIDKYEEKSLAEIRNDKIKDDREAIENLKKVLDVIDGKKLKEEKVRKAKDEGKFDLEFTEIFNDDEWELEDDNEKLKDEYIIKEYARYIDDPEHYDSSDSSYEEYKKKKKK